jgi:hypothetical protein
VTQSRINEIHRECADYSGNICYFYGDDVIRDDNRVGEEARVSANTGVGENDNATRVACAKHLAGYRNHKDLRQVGRCTVTLYYECWACFDSDKITVGKENQDNITAFC